MNAGASRWAADAEGEAGKSRLTLEFFDSIFWGVFLIWGAETAAVLAASTCPLCLRLPALASHARPETFIAPST